MSEYWVSRKKYFCRYCEIYIADDAPSRQQHENGLRHKGNKERFVRGLYKQGERKKKDLEEEKREMVRVEQAAQTAFARDVSSGHAPLASSSKSVASAPPPSLAYKKPAEKPSSRFANYSTAQSLGYTDPDVERFKAEAERRRTQGVVGDWETVILLPPIPHFVAGDQLDGDDVQRSGFATKRELDGDNDVDDTRFKVRKKMLAVGLGEIWDPGSIPIKLKSVKAKEDAKETISDNPEVDADQNLDQHKASTVPKWTSMGWKRAGIGSETVGGVFTHRGESSLESDPNQEQKANDFGCSSHKAANEQIRGKTQSMQEADRNPPTPTDATTATVRNENQEEAAVKAAVKQEEYLPGLTDSLGSRDTGRMFRKRRLVTGGAGSREAAKR